MKTLPAFIVCMLLLFAACKKDPPFTTDVPNDPNDTIPDTTTTAVYRPAWPMIKTQRLTQSGGAYVIDWLFEYDSLWRIKRMEASGNSTSIVNYSYDNNTVYRDNYPYVTLNAKGLMYMETYGGGNYTSYTFNADSQLINRSGQHSGATYTYFFKNLFNTHQWSENGGSNMQAYEDKTHTYNTNPNTIGNYNTGQYYMGQSSVNLVQHTDWHRYLSNGGTGNYGFTTYTYTYNDSGWVSQKIERDAVIIPTQIDSVTTIYDTSYTIYTYEYTYY